MQDSVGAIAVPHLAETASLKVAARVGVGILSASYDIAIKTALPNSWNVLDSKEQPKKAHCVFCHVWVSFSKTFLNVCLRSQREVLTEWR